LLNMVDDPKNCILLDRISHWMLDETEEIWINNDGRICFLNENEIKEKIIRLFGTTDIRIKSNIFNERMKYYIKEINL
jgi:ligand-binding sensor domain-containing protein